MGRGACTPAREQYLWIKEDRATYSVPRFGCGLGTILCILPDGRAYPCYTMKDERRLLGDLTRQPLHKIMESGALLGYLNETVDADPMCRTCDVRYLCGGMCRSSPLRDGIRALADQLYEGSLTDKGRETLMGLAARMGVELTSDGDTGVDGVMELTDQMLDAVAGGCDGREPLPNAAEKSYDK